jgi:hypothetical protein
MLPWLRWVFPVRGWRRRCRVARRVAAKIASGEVVIPAGSCVADYVREHPRG